MFGHFCSRKVTYCTHVTKSVKLNRNNVHLSSNNNVHKHNWSRRRLTFMISVAKGFTTSTTIHSTFLPIKLLHYPHLLAFLFIKCHDVRSTSALFHASLSYLGIKADIVIWRKTCMLGWRKVFSVLVRWAGSYNVISWKYLQAAPA